MNNILSDKEIVLLECISTFQNPVGSWVLVEELEKKGIEMSSATIGRMLSRLQKFGYLEKIAYKGRVITKEGLEALEKAKTIKNINYQKDKLDSIVTDEVLDNFLMILEARKVIERETARLAAQNITRREIDNLEKILKGQAEKSKQGLSIAEDDVAFHKAIAEASRNTVFVAIYTIVATYKQQSKLFEMIRSKINPKLNLSSHMKIFNAIKAHDEKLAEQSMVAHIENLMEDVVKYWKVYH